MSKSRTTVPRNASHDADLALVGWRRSSYSGGANDCVEVAVLTRGAAGGLAIRDSKALNQGVLLVSSTSFLAFIEGVCDSW